MGSLVLPSQQGEMPRDVGSKGGGARINVCGRYTPIGVSEVVRKWEVVRRTLLSLCTCRLVRRAGFGGAAPLGKSWVVF